MRDVCKFFVILGLYSTTAFGADHADNYANIPNATSIEQIIPADRLAAIKASLPAVGHIELQQILQSSQTLWYDDQVMTPSYQDSVGAQSNRTWPNLVAASSSVINGLWNSQHRTWQFPFGTTAGTDNSTNLVVVNFVSLPHVSGQVATIPIRKVTRNANRPQWTWAYPTGTVFGEVLFVRDGANLLPTEIRTRKRFPAGWGMNAFRPFPTARSLAAEIKARRPDWALHAKLANLVDHLEDPNTLTPKTLAATAALASTFRQSGWIDQIPDFGDTSLVRELLTSKVFVSAYDTAWKVNGSQVAFAASTTSATSVVPNHYDAGLLRVTDEDCMRCHKETGRLVSEFYGDLYLYGELWGKDGIFSFHPYDEREFPRLRHSGSGPDGYYDNRKINPALSRMGIFRMQSLVEDHQEQSGDLAEESEDEAGIDATVTYAQHIKPILDDNCVECHSTGARSPDLSRLPFTSASGADQETIVRRILARAGGAQATMPPGVRQKLTSGQTGLITSWLDQGLSP